MSSNTTNTSDLNLQAPIQLQLHHRLLLIFPVTCCSWSKSALPIPQTTTMSICNSVPNASILLSSTTVAQQSSVSFSASASIIHFQLTIAAVMPLPVQQQTTLVPITTTCSQQLILIATNKLHPCSLPSYCSCSPCSSSP
ncbi:hypothetical protein C5167_022835 [Papaver somniferum]|uniref:Uncharacterized protein n=1 Tax=Papaver somniferum TaxID=3469 RepID=A0A4Y7JJ03_PAPSO|nr:hypothetical protein C5167_022834 [Papaver somniferum]RZC61085.1 hypothetical protein C5167_022835 [Papaver somniferum]